MANGLVGGQFVVHPMAEELVQGVGTHRMSFLVCYHAQGVRAHTASKLCSLADGRSTGSDVTFAVLYLQSLVLLANASIPCFACVSMTEVNPARRFGEKLRTLRLRHGMTMQVLAEYLGTGSGYISQVENRQREPRAAFVFKVARLFGVTTDQLLDDEQEV